MNPDLLVSLSALSSLLEFVADTVLTLAFFALAPVLVVWEGKHHEYGCGTPADCL